MKNLKTTSTFLFVATMLFNFGLSAQNLIVTLTNSNTATYPISDIQSIKFGTNSMILYELNGTVNTWDIDDIDNYAFDGELNIDEEAQIIQENLSVYPNPTSDKITISYESSLSDKIIISIVDLNGKEVAHLFEGMHDQTTKVEWSAKGQGKVESGTYFCKIKTATKVTTKPIIIQ